MKDSNQNLVAFLVTLLVVVSLTVLFSHRNVSNHEVPATDTTVQTVVFDSIYRHYMQDYTIDVLKSTQKDYTKLVFRNDKEPDSFVVNVYPMNDFNEYESDVIQRFIDVHEHEKLTNYEYVHKSDGTVVQCSRY